MRPVPSFLLAISIGVLGVGCKKSMPDPWKEYDFPTDNLQETVPGQLEQRLDATYKVSNVATLQAMDLLGRFGAKIKAKGFTQTCKGEYRYSDGNRAFFDGYGKGDDRLGVITVFSESPEKKTLSVVVAKAFEKDVIYGEVFKDDCKPLQ